MIPLPNAPLPESVIYPTGAGERDRWIREQRGAKNTLDPQVPYAFLYEEEMGTDGKPIPTVTLFLTNRECPYRCLMCDLWQNTLDETVPVGAIPAQIRYALERLPAARQIKLYNAGSFFDPQAIPIADYAEIARLVSNFERVIVECHPRLIGERTLAFRDLLEEKLEVAIGLETVHPEVLKRLNKRFTVADFQRAANFLQENSIDLRVFLLLRPPFMSEDEGVYWAKRSLDTAFANGASVCCLIPTRGGNGAMEALASQGEYNPPSLRSLEVTQEYGLALRQGRVFSDLWDIEKFFDCDCSPARAERLAKMNRAQGIPPRIACSVCSAPSAVAGDSHPTPCPSPSEGEGVERGKEYDLAIIGSGFGGSLLAMVARRIGLSVLLLEKGRHPRFAIGESTSPLTNLLIEELALRYDLPRLLPLTSYGPWQRTYPEVMCGLKRGFTYLPQAAGQSNLALNGLRPLLVAASPCDELADTHWLRSDVDSFLVSEAVAAGVVYHDQAELSPPRWNEDGTVTLTYQRDGATTRETAKVRFVVDATGPRGFLSRALKIPEAPFANYPPTQALFSHFTGVGRTDERDSFYSGEELSPYSPDDAALHHLFEGGWMWVLRFGNGVTSAGVAMTDECAAEFGLSEGEAAWNRFLARFPLIAEQFSKAKAVQSFIYSSRLAYRTTVAAGHNWALLPSAAAFIDPLFSTGIPLTLLGIERLSRILEESWGKADFSERLADYGMLTLSEVDSTADFISGCYAALGNFRLFSALSMFYFAAASYSEMARRLNQRHRVSRFMAADHPEFGKAMRECNALARQIGSSTDEATAIDFEQRVTAGIEYLNIAGLSNPEKRNWYGVELQDVVDGAEKLGFTPDAMQEILKAAPWAQCKEIG